MHQLIKYSLPNVTFSLLQLDTHYLDDLSLHGDGTKLISLLTRKEKRQTSIWIEHRTRAQRLAIQCTKHQAITPNKINIPILSLQYSLLSEVTMQPSLLEVRISLLQ